MIKDNIKIAVLGGDRRQVFALLHLANTKASVSSYGLDTSVIPTERTKLISKESSPTQLLKDASVIVLPFPASVDGVHINAPLDKNGELDNFKLSTLLRLADPSAIIIGGKLPESFVAAAEEKGFAVHDLLKSEFLETKNALITAEAAISIAMNSLTKTICGSHIAITGFGRISKHLSRLLHSLGAHVTISARKDSDLAFAETLGYSTQKIEGDRWCDTLLCGYDMIYNTVPHKIFDRSFLEKIDRSTLLVELASVPGGFDIPAVHELGTNISWALSLPGKYAPESAGELIGGSIIKIISEEVVHK